MTLDTIEFSLPGYTPLSPHEVVTILGYHTPGDGGGGEFYWDNMSTEPGNSGTILEFTGLSGRWKRLYNEAINVKWFGAGGNGADDTIAIQTAFDQKQSVYFPPGDYKISATINVRLDYGTIEGHSAFIKPSGNFTALNLAGYNLQYSGLHISFEDVLVHSAINENAVAIWFFKDGTRPLDQVMNSVLSGFSILHAHTGIKSTDATGAVWQTEIRNIYMNINPGESDNKAIGIDLAGPIAGADNTTLKISKVSVQDFHETPGVGIRGMRIVGFSDVTVMNFSCDFVTQSSTAEGELLHIVANQVIIKGLAHEKITNTVDLYTSDAAPIIIVGGLGNKQDSVTIDDCLFINSKFNCGGPNAIGTWIVFRNHPKVTVGNIVNKTMSSDDGTQIKKLDCSLYRGQLNSIGNISSAEIANFERNANNCVILADYSGEVRTTAPITPTEIYTLVQASLCYLIAVKGFDATNGLICFYEIVSIATTFSGAKATAIVSSNKINYSYNNIYSIDANNNVVLERSGGNVFTIFTKTISML